MRPTAQEQYEITATCDACGEVVGRPVFAMTPPGRDQHDGWRMVLLARHRNTSTTCPARYRTLEQIMEAPIDNDTTDTEGVFGRGGAGEVPAPALQESLF